ncbi:MAG: 2-amino-4-hydroxy-6-hydroxymethyldihydropteridine diphosphokinase, partial [Acidobacteriota bacterium]|nr:2-amino-4-hydroxy-6-hydroxymethyldihydropteridine diphosphokinase [Acidobacteriota bacterium]
MKLVYLALGSNLGNRAATLHSAVERLQSPQLILIRLSTVRETDPVGIEDQ